MEGRGAIELRIWLFGMTWGGPDEVVGGLKPLKPPLSITMAPES